MNNEIQQTDYILPLTYLNNGLISSEWVNPTYLLLQDDFVAESDSSQGATADVMVGNFNFAIPVGAVVTGIKFKVRGYVGAITVPAATLTFNAVNNLSGTIEYYPYTAPFDGFTQSMASYEFGSQDYLFDHEWTVDEINNFKLQLVGAGDIFIDDVQAQVFYYIPGTPTPPTPGSNFCLSCESPVQGVEYFLALDLDANDTVAYVKDFNYADGTPIQITDVGDCGGSIEITIDKGKIAVNGNNFMENARIIDIDRLPSGLVKLDFGSIQNRGLAFKTPYTHDVDLLSPHSINASIVISNNGPFYDKYVRICQKGVVYSAPITVQDEGTDVLEAVETFNFKGDNVQAEADSVDDTKVNITILSNPTNQAPEVEDTSTGTTGAGTATSLTISHEIIDANYLRVWVSTDDETISGVTYDGVAMTLVGSETNGPNDLKVALYGLINPNAGVNDIVISMGAAAHISGGGVSFLNVDTSNPTDAVSSGAIGSGTAPTDSVTTTSQNSLVMSVVGGVNNTTAFAESYPWTIRAQVNAALRPGATSTRKVLLPASVTDTYTISPTGPWAILLAGVRGISTPLGGVDSVTGSTVDNTDPQNPVVNAHTKIQFQDEGTNLGSTGTVNEVDITGAGATATRVGNKLTINIPGGGGSALDLETNGTPNGDQTLLNLIAGPGMSITDDGFGGITFESTGGGSSSFASGVAIQGINASPVTLTITHGMGVIPKRIKLSTVYDPEAGTGQNGFVCIGSYDAGSQNCVAMRAGAAAAEYPVAYAGAAFISLLSGGGTTPTTVGVINNITTTTFDIVFTGASANFVTHIMWETTGGSSTGTISEQDITYFVGSQTTGASNTRFATNQDGSVACILQYDGANTFNIFRLERDSSTGLYVITHTTSLAAVNATGWNISFTGSYIYICYVVSSTGTIRRYDVADLANVTTITVSGNFINSDTVFSNGTDIYIYNTGADFYRYTISGTTATQAATITYTGGASIQAATCNGTNVFMTANINGAITLLKYAVAGGASTGTLVRYIYRTAYPNPGVLQLFIPSAGNLGFAIAHSLSTDVVITGAGVKLTAISQF